MVISRKSPNFARHVRDISATKALHPFPYRGGASPRPILVTVLKMISPSIKLTE
jgi:hypothetical protein